VNEERLRQLLEKFKAGAAHADDVVRELSALPFADLGYAMIDHHRALRQGAPEVVLGDAKTVEQIAGIANELLLRGANVMVTRVSDEKAAAVCTACPRLTHRPEAKMLTCEQKPIVPIGDGYVAVVTAGTSDLPVAEECAETLRMLGARTKRITDVGVAGIHRLLAQKEALEAAKVIIVIAGMEGALASVVGGLVSSPVISVPTSVGYGAAFNGIAALLGMLTSCASGITVVNIDNGFGAAFAAFRILRAGAKEK